MFALAHFLPTEVATVFGFKPFDETTSFYIRAGLVGFGLWVGLVVRGHPWWVTVFCAMIALFGAGQILRSMFTPEVKGIPISLLIVDVFCFLWLAVMAVRPTVYERLHDAQIEMQKLKDGTL